MFDDFTSLIQIHYISQREDTDFWKYCKYEMKKTDKKSKLYFFCFYCTEITVDCSCRITET